MDYVSFFPSFQEFFIFEKSLIVLAKLPYKISYRTDKCPGCQQGVNVSALPGMIHVRGMGMAPVMGLTFSPGQANESNTFLSIYMNVLIIKRHGDKNTTTKYSCLYYQSI